MIQLRFASIPANVHRVKDLLQRIEETYQTTLSEDARYRLIIAVSEAINNAIEHGSRDQEGAMVEIRSERRDGGLYVWVIDEGSGFEPADLPDPRTEEQLLSERGRGILLMENLADRLRFYQSPEGFVTELWFDNIFQ